METIRRKLPWAPTITSTHRPASRLGDSVFPPVLMDDGFTLYKGRDLPLHTGFHSPPPHPALIQSRRVLQAVPPLCCTISFPSFLVPHEHSLIRKKPKNLSVLLPLPLTPSPVALLPFSKIPQKSCIYLLSPILLSFLLLSPLSPKTTLVRWPQQMQLSFAVLSLTCQQHLKHPLPFYISTSFTFYTTFPVFHLPHCFSFFPGALAALSILKCPKTQP